MDRGFKFQNRSQVAIKPKINIKGILLILISILLFVLLFMIIRYYATSCYIKKDLNTYLTDSSFDPCAERYAPASLKEREYLDEREVFHISDQIYTYEQAKCKCEAYGAKLATKDQMIEAYNKGADWCTYGWCEGGEAFYPTQKCTFDKMQRLPKNKRFTCGLPGLNGGKFNKNVRFGINCYGIKPKGHMLKKDTKYCDGPGKKFCDRGENNDASHKLGSDNISPFNTDYWSEYSS